MTVGELLKRISALELAEWQAFEQVHGPVGVEARIDHAAALIAERVTNCLTTTKGKPPTLDDFLPRYGRTLDGYDERRTGGEPPP